MRAFLYCLSLNDDCVAERRLELPIRAWNKVLIETTVLMLPEEFIPPRKNELDPNLLSERARSVLLSYGPNNSWQLRPGIAGVFGGQLSVDTKLFGCVDARLIRVPSKHANPSYLPPAGWVHRLAGGILAMEIFWNPVLVNVLTVRAVFGEGVSESLFIQCRVQSSQGEVLTFRKIMASLRGSIRFTQFEENQKISQFGDLDLPISYQDPGSLSCNKDLHNIGLPSDSHLFTYGVTNQLLNLWQ